MMIGKAVREILDLVFPPACEVCGEVGEPGLCSNCIQQIVPVEEPYCAHCGKPFDPNVARPPQLCESCRSNAPSFDGARAVGLHTGPLRRVIITYKFNGRTSLAVFLARLLTERVAAEAEASWPLPLADVDAVVPVPLHPHRKRWRGFDQAALLARPLGRAMEKAVWEDCMVRDRPTLPQVGLTLQQRRDNVKNAFSVREKRRIINKRLLLVDDVYTTGATGMDAARALKAAGAAEVYLVTVSRAVPAWHPASQVAEPPEVGY
jgi:ComF family protein